MSAGDLRTDLWAFMLAIYAQPGVASACLRLQEAHGLDVPLALAALHGVATGKRLDAAAVRALDTACTEWRARVIQPLRRLRRDMKDAHLLAWHADAPALREAVKAQELQAESLQARVLHALIRALPEAEHPDYDDVLALVLDLRDPGRAPRLSADARHITKSCATLLRQPHPPAET